MTPKPTPPKDAAAFETYVALLRGINVGRAKPVAMADLRAIVESLGYQDVRTLLRSGNVVLRTADGDPPAIATSIQEAIARRLGMTVGVIVRTADELAAVVDANPLPEAVAHGAALHVMFLAAPPSDAERTALTTADFGPDEVRMAEREIYVWYRDGMMATDTAPRLVKLVRTMATDRNWNTVGKLLAIARPR